ncbi:MAG: AraC family transcriptional regulator [Actinomycetota bacterium]|nr:AraC family transcriptional regulator [Actinomycetota bacterium]
MSEYSVYFRPAELPGVEALHARFVEHSYAPHSHPTWTVAVVHHGAASFDVDATHQRADRGELFVLEPEAVHTGMAAVPEGWAYEVLYLDPALLHEWDEGDAALPRAARWVVFRDRALRESLVRMHAVLRAGTGGLELDESVLGAVEALRPHLRPGPPPLRGGAEHVAVRRPREYLVERWDQPVPLASLASFAGLTRFELVRRFRQQAGLTPHAFQTNLRVARARAMLIAGDPIAWVAAACGFADQSHLTRTFRRTVGVTPGRFASA